ncbi:class I SAM-dependent DNA methyltransferase [uncultured Aquimarina sp.]|uniref:type I restriction-modification system subunit M n=1 Tax=uncultured Aquimarina sp. TaxID=575652 RepID=UPI00261F947A|nr:class I SAM-dependent DNA methyltransferase [uncultured Aquimarina sp.]
MAKQVIKTKSIEETLWQSCDKLRGSVESSEYKHVVLGLIFLKFASDKFEERRKELIAEDKEKYVEMKDFYNMKNVFFLNETSRWSFIKSNAKQDDLALKIDTALHNIEKNNPALKGALPDNYFSRLGLDKTKLASLIDQISEINTIADKQNDIVGRVYEYFLAKFAIKEGKGKGEFYTPKSIVNLIAEMIEPYQGIIYDPACGSGGMFVQSVKFIENHHGNKKEVSVYGQEYTNTTYKLAKMNLAIRGISANLGEKAADTFGADQHPDLKADFIMANPPFNQKDWRAENELTDDPRWKGYDVPPKSNANYGWILNMVSKLSDNGVAGFILANGALSGSGEEYKIRKKLIENNLVESIIILPRNMFYTTDISVTLWILNKNKTTKTVSKGTETREYRLRESEILFMDLRQKGEPFEKKYIQFSPLQIDDIANTFHTWQTNEETYKDIPEYCYSANKAEVIKKDFSLVPSKYIEFVNRDENIDFDTKMKGLQTDLKELLAQEEQSKADLQNVFKELGYEL